MFVHAPKCAIDRKKSLKGRRTSMGGGSGALDPFVVTKHQPSNDQRAMGHMRVTPGAKAPSAVPGLKAWRAVANRFRLRDNPMFGGPGV